MKVRFQRWKVALVVVTTATVIGGSSLEAHASPVPSATQNAQSGQKGQKQAPQKINKKEEAAYKAIFDARGQQDVAKEIQMCEDFAQKYPQSPYLPSIYSDLTMDYMNTGQDDKMFAAGKKALALNPNNVDVLSLLAMALPRRIQPNSPDADKKLQQAADYAQKAIALIPTLTKPAGLDEASFEKAKNNKLAMAHSGLGLVEFQQQKYEDARNDLMQAIQLASSPDPVDYYLLGNADVQASYYNDAVTAFEKCAATSPALAAQCNARAEAAKKDAATKLGR